MTERERDGPANAGAGAGDNRFLAFEQFTIFGFRNNRLWQIHEILRMRHFPFRTIRWFGGHGWHKICWFCGFVVTICDSLQTRIMDCASVLGLLTVAGKSLLYRPLTCTAEVASVGIALVTKAHVIPTGINFFHEA